jgi:hypothetical protein
MGPLKPKTPPAEAERGYRLPDNGAVTLAHARPIRTKLHLVKRALAVAVAALERAPDTHLKPISGIKDMKALLDDMIP